MDGFIRVYKQAVEEEEMKREECVDVENSFERSEKNKNTIEQGGGQGRRPKARQVE